MNDLISRHGTLDEISKQQTYKMFEGEDTMYLDANDVGSVIASMPSAQPETAKRIVGRSRDGMTLWYQCDMCHEPVDAQDNYCRGCGRRLIDE